MAAISGKNSRVTYNGVNLLAHRWTLNLKIDEIDVTNFESPTASINAKTFALNQFLEGFFDWEFTADAYWNAGTNVFISPPGIFPGGLTGTVLLYVDRTNLPGAGGIVTMTNPHVMSVSPSTEVRGAVGYTFSMKNGATATSTIAIGASL